jgi:hypothetical protein
MGHGVSHSVDDPLVARLELIGSVVPRQADDLLPCDVGGVDGYVGGVDDERVMLVLGEVGVRAGYSSRTRSSVLPSSRSSPQVHIGSSAGTLRNSSATGRSASRTSPADGGRNRSHPASGLRSPGERRSSSVFAPRAGAGDGRLPAAPALRCARAGLRVFFFFAMCPPWDSEAGGMPVARPDGALARIILRRQADHFE